MAIIVRLHVTSEILAVATQPTEHHFVTIPVGSMIETRGDFAEPGLHQVAFNGQELLAFTRDIRERTEQVKATSVG